MMFAAFHVPDFEVVAGLRVQPEARGFPCVVLGEEGGRGGKERFVVVAVNGLGRAAGVREGWDFNRALACCAELRVIGRDVAGEQALREELLFFAESLGPDVELSAGDTVTVDLASRVGRAWPVVGDVLLDDVVVWHARAATADLAGLAARDERTRGGVVMAGDLAVLPLIFLELLAGGSKALRLLEFWGLRTLGDFMELPRQELVERLGAEVGRWHDVLHGKRGRLLSLHRPSEAMGEGLEFEEGVVSLDFLVEALRGLLGVLAARLAARFLAADGLVLALVLEGGGELRRRVGFAEPQVDPEAMLARVVVVLESLALKGAVCGLQVEMETTFGGALQGEWFGRQMAQPGRWAETLVKLECLLGPGRVGVPVPGDTFRPDVFEMTAAGSGKWVEGGGDSLPLCRFRPRREVAVAHEMRGGRPFPLAVLSGFAAGRIVGRRGPFVCSGDWWDGEGAWQRLEWDVEVAGGFFLRLVCERGGKWFVEGRYL